MSFTTYFLAAVISYFGLLVGIILAYVSPEEQKPGAKYFSMLKKAFFILIMGFFLFYYKINAFFITAIIVFLIILAFTNKLRLEKTPLTYFLLGVIFGLSNKFFSLLVITSVLIFLYGIPTASSKLKKKNHKEILVSNLWFFVPILILYFAL